MKKISVSIGVFAHNEEKNIEKTLNSILKQKTELASIKEILVISSGSNDKTNNVVRRFCKKYKIIKLLVEFDRQGKSSAINLFINSSHSPVLVSISADLRLNGEAIEEIILPFLEPEVGMVGAHPIPCNLKYSQIGKEAALLWKLHHHVSLKHPKCGEMVAFKKVLRLIPKESAVDEATIEVLLKLIGYKIVYAPRSIVYNKIPLTAADFIKQRRRVYAGHKWLSGKYNYQVSTMDSSNNFEAILNYLSSNPSDSFSMIKLLILEFISRILGWLDFNILGRNPYVWDMVKR